MTTPGTPGGDGILLGEMGETGTSAGRWGFTFGFPLLHLLCFPLMVFGRSLQLPRVSTTRGGFGAVSSVSSMSQDQVCSLSTTFGSNQVSQVPSQQTPNCIMRQDMAAPSPGQNHLPLSRRIPGFPNPHWEMPQCSLPTHEHRVWPLHHKKRKTNSTRKNFQEPEPTAATQEPKPRGKIKPSPWPRSPKHQRVSPPLPNRCGPDPKVHADILTHLPCFIKPFPESSHPHL